MENIIKVQEAVVEPKSSRNQLKPVSPQIERMMKKLVASWGNQANAVQGKVANLHLGSNRQVSTNNLPPHSKQVEAVKNRLKVEMSIE